MEHIKNLLSIAKERVKIKKENAEKMEEFFEIKSDEKESWVEFTFIFDYLLSNFDDFQENVNSLKGEDFEKIDRIIQETAEESDFEFAYQIVEKYLKEKTDKGA